MSLVTRAALVVLAGAAPTLACTLLLDTNGFAGDPAPSPTPAESGAGDGPGPAPSDAAVGPADAPPEGGQDGAPPCPDGAFCDAFDDEGTPFVKWTGKDVSKATLDLGAGLSPPSAARVSVAATGGFAVLQKAVPPAATKIRCDVDVKLAAAPTGGEVDYLTFETSGGARTHSLYLAHFADGWAVAEFAPAAGAAASVNRTQPLVATPPIGAWFHLTIETDGSALSATVDGAKTTLTSLTAVAGTQQMILVGVDYATNDATASALYDDVVCLAL